MGKMELSSRNIDKTIRTVKRSLASLKTDTSLRCNFCGKRIRKNRFLAMLNGFGWFNYYHPKCLLNKNE